jgi:hypothetical protein
MSEIYNNAIKCSEKILYKFHQTGMVVKEEECLKLRGKYPMLNWTSGIFSSNSYRRAHIDIIDAMDTHKLWIMHTVILPHLNDPSPILGFDVICGPTRISGAFHDFSNGGDPNHPMMQWFSEKVENLQWKKERRLPEWAEKIFSPSMVAAGAISSEEEANQFLNLGVENISYYLKNVGKTEQEGFACYPAAIEAQRNYTVNQRLNPHTPRTMTMLGMSEEDARVFMDSVLFPPI